MSVILDGVLWTPIPLPPCGVRDDDPHDGDAPRYVIEQLELSTKDLALWLQALKGALGCGGAVEETALVLQGDHRERAVKLLVARGVRKVISG